MDYDDLSNTIQAHRVGGFAMPTKQLAQVFARTMLLLAADRAKRSPPSSVAHEESSTTDEAEAEDLISNRLQEELDAIERDQCRSRST